jgi:DNA-directed RNA polymerase specialized sigma24 family protein
MKSMELRTREPSPVEVNSIPGQAEKKLERTQADWRRRCEGATMMSLAKVFGLAVGAIHNYIETVRKQLREQTVKLAAQEREQSL